jgi:hypothetical protein
MTRTDRARQAAAEKLFLQIQVATVRGLLSQALPLARVFTEAGLEPNEAVLITREMYAVLGTIAEQILETPNVLTGLPVELMDEDSTQELIEHLQGEQRRPS